MVYKLPEGKLVRKINIGKDFSRAATISQDHKTISSYCSSSSRVHTWDLASGKKKTVGLPIGLASVSVADFSRDGRLLLLGSQTGTVLVWDTIRNREIRKFKPHMGWIESIRLSPDGRRVLSASRDGTAQIWDIYSDSRLSGRMTGHRGAISSFILQPGSNTALSAGLDGTIRLWDIVGNMEITILGSHKGGATALALTPDGKTAVSAGLDGFVRIWDISKLQQRNALRSTVGISAILIRPNGKTAILGCQDGGLRVVSLDSNGTIPDQPLAKAGNALVAMDISPDGEKLVTADSGGQVKLWQWKNNQIQPISVLESSAKAIRRIRFFSKGNSVISAGKDGLRIWNVKSGKQERHFASNVGPLNDVRILPVGSFAISAGDDEKIRLWQLSNGKQIQQICGHHGAVTQLALSPMGATLFSTGKSGTIRIWKLNDSSARRFLVGGEKTIASFGADDKIVMTTFPQTVHLYQKDTKKLIKQIQLGAGAETALLTPDGREIIWIALGGKILCKNVAEKQAAKSIKIPLAAKQITLAGDGRLLLVQSSEGVCLFDRKHNRAVDVSCCGKTRLVAMSSRGNRIAWVNKAGLLRTQPLEIEKKLNAKQAAKPSTSKPLGCCLLAPAADGTAGSFSSLAVSPNGLRIAAGRSDGSIIVWSVKTGKVLREFKVHTGKVTRLIFLPDMERIASVGKDKAVSVVNVVTGKKMNWFEGHLGQITSLAASADAGTLLTASSDGAVRLWKVGWQLRMIPAKTRSVRCVRFSPDGKQFGFTVNGSVLVMNTETNTRMAALPHRGGDLLTIVFAPGANELISDGKKSLRRWNFKTKKRLQDYAGPSGFTNALVVSSDGKKLAAAAHSRPNIRLWDIQTGECLAVFETSRKFAFLFRGVAFSPDGKTLASDDMSQGADGKKKYMIKLWNLKDNSVAGTIEDAPDLITQLFFSPDGKYLAAGGMSSIKVYELNKKTVLWQQASPGSIGFSTVTFTPDGKQVIFDYKEKFHVCDAFTGKVIKTLEGQSRYFRSAAVSPDGRYLLGGGLGSVYLWWLGSNAASADPHAAKTPKN
ncbi:MAG: WD40 repeat domain-containing protein [Phycisphaerae bacterium]|nr:WD40 repeat domain-containing protein [Phycisphaerae bacterium]